MILAALKHAVVLLCILAIVTAQLTLPGCRDDAACISEQTTIYLTANTANSGYSYLHLVLNDLSVISVPDSERPKLHITVSPCNGSAYLLVNPLAPPIVDDDVDNLEPFPFPSISAAVWNASKPHTVNELSVRLQFAQYYISVFTPQPTIQIAQGAVITSSPIVFRVDTYLVHPITGVPVTANAPPQLGGSVVPTAVLDTGLILTDERIPMDVYFNTSADPMWYEYRAFYAWSPVLDDADIDNALPASAACAVRNSSITANGDLLPDVALPYADSDRCITDSPCGVMSSMSASDQEWTLLPPDSQQALRVSGLQQQETYIFTILVRNPQTGQLSSYTASRGMPTYEKVDAMEDSTTIAIIAGSAAGSFLLLVVLAFVVKCHIHRRLHHSNARYVLIAHKAVETVRRRSSVSVPRGTKFEGKSSERDSDPAVHSPQARTPQPSSKLRKRVGVRTRTDFPLSSPSSVQMDNFSMFSPASSTRSIPNRLILAMHGGPLSPSETSPVPTLGDDNDDGIHAVPDVCDDTAALANPDEEHQAVSPLRPTLVAPNHGIASVRYHLTGRRPTNPLGPPDDVEINI